MITAKRYLEIVCNLQVMMRQQSRESGAYQVDSTAFKFLLFATSVVRN